ncbi:hypothetical protein D9M68_514080 [compost metagenome]
MKTYARVYDGAVAELFSTDGDIAEMFHPDLIWVEITDMDHIPSIGWVHDGGTFMPRPSSTPEQIVAENA